jgi:hypothetical protein
MISGTGIVPRKNSENGEGPICEAGKNMRPEKTLRRNIPSNAVWIPEMIKCHDDIR